MPENRMKLLASVLVYYCLSAAQETDAGFLGSFEATTRALPSSSSTRYLSQRARRRRRRRRRIIDAGTTACYAQQRETPSAPSSVQADAASSNEDDAVDYREEEEDTEKQRGLRPPPFPPSSYHLAHDEERIKHNFISFIDHFDEPYSQVSRLIQPRGYAVASAFTSVNNHTAATHQPASSKVTAPPPPEVAAAVAAASQSSIEYKNVTIDDVACPPSLYGPIATFLSWNRLPARIVVGTIAYFAFPPLVSFLETLTGIGDTGSLPDWVFRSGPRPNFWAIDIQQRNDLATLVNLYLPGVSIVLGTYYSMTLSLLYDRFSRLQQTVSSEASMLAHLFHSLLSLFEDDPEALVEGVQYIVDQMHTMIRESRGRETMRIIYTDPYVGIMRLMQRMRRDPGCELSPQMLGAVCDGVRLLFDIRSRRMSDEALGLSPTHYDVMTFLSGLFLFGIALGTVATAQTDGIPTQVSRILFSSLVVCYTTIYEMSYDLNQPFDGVYQLRRSGAATHFLQIRQTILSHPVLRDRIEFDPQYEWSMEDVPEIDGRQKATVWYN